MNNETYRCWALFFLHNRPLMPSLHLLSGSTLDKLLKFYLSAKRGKKSLFLSFTVVTFIQNTVFLKHTITYYYVISIKLFISIKLTIVSLHFVSHTVS